MAINIAYFGTPDFSSRFLEKLINDPSLPINVKLVVTQGDKPVGRKQELTQSPVKKVALANNIPVLESATIDDLQKYSIDLALVFAYGKIIPNELLQGTKYGFWNVHPSLLPEYRGASPTAYALIMGDEVAGCTLMQMDQQLDHGPIIAQDSLRIQKKETHESLLEKLSYVGYYLFRENITKLDNGNLDISKLAVQNDSLATQTRTLKREDGYLPIDLIKKALNKEKVTSQEFPQIMRDYLGQTSISEFPIPYAPYIVFNFCRGMNPWPGAWTKVNINGQEKRLKLMDVTLEEDTLVIEKVQLEGKNTVDFKQFQEAYKIF